MEAAAGCRLRRRENIGMLDWLQTQGLDPFTQSAAYYRLTGDAPEVNTVEVSSAERFARRGVCTGFDGKGNGR